ncbi:MAG: outer membrane protein assembly factor BamB family protein [Isosphaeraceae bacterium]
MATLEVHDAQGRVQFVELARNEPILFGASPHCDIILEGAGIKPVHGRIRYKAGRFKVEASPDAEFIVINGHRMTNGSIEQGDEITVGPCRLVLTRAGDEDAGTSRPGSARPMEEGRTTVMPPPSAPASYQQGGGGRAVPPAAGGRPTRYAQPGEAGAEQQDWTRDPGVDEEADSESGDDWGEPQGAGGFKRMVARILRRLRPAHTGAPGQEKILSSPLIVGLAGLLVILILLGFWLRSSIARMSADRAYNHAMSLFEEGDYRTAIRGFDEFIAGNPDDARAPKAQVMRAMANVRQYISPSGSTWTSAHEAARSMFEEFSKSGPSAAAFRDERPELGDLVVRIGEGLADRARGSADPKALAEAESAVSLHAQIAGEAAAAELAKSRLPSKLAEARAAVKKAGTRSKLLGDMDKAIADGVASKVYEARDALLAQYADLAQDRELIKRMTSANDLVKKAVKVDTTRKPAARGPRPDPLGPPTSVVLRTTYEPAPTTPSPDSIVFALADGMGYGIDAAHGAPVWQVPLGLAAPFIPQPIPGEPAAIAFDARSNELIRINSLTGAVVWRLELGERVADPPLLLGNQLIQVAPSGKLLFISLDSGELTTTMTLGRPLARAPVGDESGRHLYVLGRQDILLVLNRDPLSCAAVEYLGHADNSIPCPPALIGRLLVVPQNDSMADGRWQILLIDEEGTKVKPVQEIKIAGWTWQTPAQSGPFVWATGDRMGFEAFAVGEETSKNPFRSVAKLTPDQKASGPSYAIGRSERELWAACGHSGKYKLDPEHGTIEYSPPLQAPGPASGLFQKAGKYLIATFLDRDLEGTALWAIDPDTASVAWKTVVGAPWHTKLGRLGTPPAFSMLTRDGREVTISDDQAARGGFAVGGIPRQGAFALPSGRQLRVEHDGKTVNVLVPKPFSKSLWLPDRARPGGWRELTLPATVAADPLVWQGGIVIPGADGRVYLVDPSSGQSMAEPFVPKFDRDHQGSWLAPVLLDPETLILADNVGRVRRLVLKTMPVPRLVAEAERTLDKGIVADPATTGGSVLVATADGQIRSLAARDLSPIGAWPLESSIAGEPVGLGDGGLAMDRAGGIMAFGRDGQKSWTIKLGAEVAGAPLVVGRSLVILTSDGVLHLRARSDGAPMDRRPLGVLPAGGPIAAGRDAMIPVAPGTIRPLALDLLSH